MSFGTSELALPPQLREPVRQHLEDLRKKYVAMDWARRVGFGQRPAVLVIDLALFWTRPDTQMGSDLDPIVEATGRVLAAARRANAPIFFSSYDFDATELPGLKPRKVRLNASPQDAHLFNLDPRLQRRPNEKLFRKRHASCFAGTNLMNILATLNVDTLIVTGVSTSHCVYATCRDAAAAFRVIVPREAVGERCQIMHMVNLLDIDIDLGDVMPVADVIEHLER